MSSDTSDVAPPETAVTPSRMRARAWRLAAWLAFVGATLGVYWRSDAPQDYKNSAAVIAAILALAGTSLWVLRNAGGTPVSRWGKAILLWAPLWVVSPWGLVKLIHNGNVGVVGWRWRWDPAPDELLSAAHTTGESIPWRTTEHDYPAFLGGKPWAEVPGDDLEPNLTQHPPKLLWKQPIGAGWSGFAIVGDYAVTQEQRGPREMVVCYELRTGRVAWTHQDPVRWDPGGNGALGKIGPRATPTLHDRRVYTHGATGILNCLDATTGRVLWSHDTLEEEGVDNLMWGKAGSPIVVDDWIVVSVGGTNDNSLVAYDLKTGKRAWSGGDFVSSYATPVLTELAGVRQIVTVNQNLVTGQNATSGEVLWEFDWPGDSGSNASASQPMPIGGDRLLLTKGYSVPSQVIEVTRAADGAWQPRRVWQKPVMRTKLSNVVIRDGYAYGISDIDLECIDLATGQRKWKSRRRPAPENGQILLAGKHIVIAGETGEVVIVEATPQKYLEVGSFQALDSGVAWNNPALSGNILLVRNAEQAAAYELPLRTTAATDQN
jgi:outer membrane protein assembly factor BamB